MVAQQHWPTEVFAASVLAFLCQGASQRATCRSIDRAADISQLRDSAFYYSDASSPQLAFEFVVLALG